MTNYYTYIGYITEYIILNKTFFIYNVYIYKYIYHYNNLV